MVSTSYTVSSQLGLVLIFRSSLEAEGLERTYKYRQSDILESVNEAARQKVSLEGLGSD